MVHIDISFGNGYHRVECTVGHLLTIPPLEPSPKLMMEICIQLEGKKGILHLQGLSSVSIVTLKKISKLHPNPAQQIHHSPLIKRSSALVHNHHASPSLNKPINFSHLETSLGASLRTLLCFPVRTLLIGFHCDRAHV